MAEANNTVTGNQSLTTINELALAIEALAAPDQTESLSTFVVEGLLVGIQHLAQKITRLSQTDLGPDLEEEGI
jgi:hypothetical protein